MIAGHFHTYAREADATAERARAALTIASEQGFLFPLARATFDEGWRLAQKGHGAKGIAQMRQATAFLRPNSADVTMSHNLCVIAEAHCELGQTDEGLTALADAWTFAHKNSERLWEAELYRINGKLLLQRAGHGEIEDSEAQQREVEAWVLQGFQWVTMGGASTPSRYPDEGLALSGASREPLAWDLAHSEGFDLSIENRLPCEMPYLPQARKLPTPAEARRA